MAAELEQSIRDNAQGPAEAHGDAGGVRQHNLRDQIEADRYLESKNAIKKKGLSIGFKKLVPPGCD